MLSEVATLTVTRCTPKTGCSHTIFAIDQSPPLAYLDQGGATKWIMYRSGSGHYKKFYRREMYMEELATRSGDPDEFIIKGYEGRWYSDHSEYSRQIDLRAADVAAAKALLRDPHITVEQVAKRLNVSPSTLYRHLPDGRGAVDS